MKMLTRNAYDLIKARFPWEKFSPPSHAGSYAPGGAAHQWMDREVKQREAAQQKKRPLFLNLKPSQQASTGQGGAIKLPSGQEFHPHLNPGDNHAHLDWKGHAEAGMWHKMAASNAFHKKAFDEYGLHADKSEAHWQHSVKARGRVDLAHHDSVEDHPTLKHDTHLKMTPDGQRFQPHGS
jgi:hypothetical protein